MSAASPRFTFALVVAPHATETVSRFEELAAWMRAEAGIDLNARAVSTYEELATSVGDGSTDVTWLPPVVYAWFAEAVSPIGSIVREGQTSYSAALVVLDASKIKTVKDLVKVRAGWVDPWSAAGYVVPRLELARLGILPPGAFRSEVFHGSHREALLALGRDECDVVGTYARPPADGQATTEGAWSDVDEVKSRVRVLATCGAIPTDVIAVRRNFAPTDYALVSSAFRRACTDDGGRVLVRAVFGGDAFREGLLPGHDALRRSYERGLSSGLFD